MNTTADASRLAGIQPGDTLPERFFTTDIIQSMLYNAVLWNAHRIHFDETQTSHALHFKKGRRQATVSLRDVRRTIRGLGNRSYRQPPARREQRFE